MSKIECLVPNVIANVNQFMDAMMNNYKKRIGYQIPVLEFYINNPEICANMLSTHEYGPVFAPVFSLLEDKNYYDKYIKPYLPQMLSPSNDNSQQVSINMEYEPSIKTRFPRLFESDYKILIFAIYQDIQHLFYEIANKIIIRNVDLEYYKIIINICFSKYMYHPQYFDYFMNYSCVEFDIIKYCCDYNRGLCIFNDFNYNALPHYVNLMYKFNNMDSPCNCLSNVKEETELSEFLLLNDKSLSNIREKTELSEFLLLNDKSLSNTCNKSLTNPCNVELYENHRKVNCRIIMFTMLCRNYDSFKNYFDNFIVNNVDNVITLQILLRFSIMLENLEFFKYIVENASMTKIQIVNDLPTFVLNSTENMEFLKYIFNGKCRTRKLEMCQICNIGEINCVREIRNQIEYDKCKKYIDNKTRVVSKNK